MTPELPFTFTTTTIILFTLSGIILVGIGARMAIKAKQAATGWVKYSGTSTLIWISIFWLFVCAAANSLFHKPILLVVGTLPLILIAISKIFSKRRKKHEIQN